MTNLTKDTEQEKSVIFVHIPKTGGTTFRTIINRQYDPQSVFLFKRPPEKSLAEFKELPEAKKREIKFIQGHMRFGLHEFFPQPCTYITILRDPVDRIISLYYFILRNPENAVHNEVVSKNMSLEDWVRSGLTTLVNNNQTRFLCTTEVVTDYGQCSSEMLESAKKNIEKYFAVVGLMERYDESLLLLKRNLKWKTPLYIRSNVTKKRPPKESVSKDTLKVIEKYNELDIELYRYGKEKFEEQLNQSSYSFGMEMKQFQLLNKIYSQTYPFYKKVISKVK